jgi:phage-related protein
MSIAETTPKRADPLLAVAKVLVIIAQIVMIFAMVMVGIGTAAVLTLQRAELMGEIAKAGAPAMSAGLIIAAMLIVIGLLYLAWRFFKELLGIINSVADGEPFHPDNADRLSRMGWITVIAQVAMLPIAGIAAWLDQYMDKVVSHFHVDSSVDFEGVLLTLILFILARVFREGARMREELEGTV